MLLVSMIDLEQHSLYHPLRYLHVHHPINLAMDRRDTLRRNHSRRGIETGIKNPGEHNVDLTTGRHDRILRRKTDLILPGIVSNRQDITIRHLQLE